MLKTIILVLLTSVGCNITKSSTNTKSKALDNEKQNIEIQDITIKKRIDISEEQLRFKIKNIVQKENALVVDVNFGGGCVDNHEFELYSTGKPDANGVVDLYLLHNTKDNCKMMLMQQRVFDITKLNKRKNFTQFRINQGEIISAKKAK